MKEFTERELFQNYNSRNLKRGPDREISDGKMMRKPKMQKAT
jgi:hypothetical protein